METESTCLNVQLNTREHLEVIDRTTSESFGIIPRLEHTEPSDGVRELLAHVLLLRVLSKQVWIPRVSPLESNVGLYHVFDICPKK